MMIILQIFIMLMMVGALVYCVPKFIREHMEDRRLIRKAIIEGRENIFEDEN